MGVALFLLAEVATLVFFAALAAGTALIVLHMEEGRDWAVRRLEDLAAGSGMALTIEGLSGRLPFDITLERVTLADAGGVWLVADGGRVRLDPLDLLDRKVTVKALTSRRIEIRRAPETGAQPGAGEDATMPVPPVPVRIETLAVGEMVLGTELVGRPLVFALTANAEATGRAGAPLAHGRLALDGGGAHFSTAWSLGPDRVTLADLSLTAGSNRLTGALTLGLRDSLADGRVVADVPEIAAFSELAGRALAGRFQGDVRFEPAGGRQNVTARVRGGGLSVPEAAAGSLDLTASIQDVLGTPSGRVEIVGEDIRAGDTGVARIAAVLDGGLADAGVSIDLAAPALDIPQARIAGRVGRSGTETRIALDRFEATYRGEPVRLTAPTRAVLAPGRLHLDETRIAMLDGGLSASASIDGERIAADAVLRALPLAGLRRLAPLPVVDGTIGATLHLSGTRSSPQGTLAMTLDRLATPQTIDTGLPALDARLDADWTGGRVAARATLASPDRRIDLAARAEVPVRLAGDDLVPMPPADARVNAALTGTVKLDLLDTLLAASGDRARGEIRLDLTAAGPLGSPGLGGGARLTGGSYENRASGTVVTDLGGELIADGDALRLRDLRGRTQGGGTVSGEGQIRPFAPGGPLIDARLRANDARVLATDLGRVVVGADLHLAGPVTEAALSGVVRVDRAEIRIPNRLPAQVVDLDVVEVTRPRPRGGGPVLPRRKPPVPKTDAPTAEAPTGGGPALALDVAVEAPARIVVRGRGLEAELKGRLRAEGTTAAPRLTGRMELVRGQLSLLGQRFTFTRFVIDFDGRSPPEPRLDIIASATANGATAVITITGTTANPSVELTSPEGLPRDEALARVLFGRSVSELGPAEAVQLAQSVADLAGLGGGDMVGQVRRSLGLDRLGLVTGATGSAVEAGSYIAEGVYVGVRQGVGTGDTSARVELDITDNIKAQADVGARGGSKVGVTFEWEY